MTCSKNSVQIITMGCSKNKVDSEHILYGLKNKFEIKEEENQDFVDYLIINTCGFIGDAKEESIQIILDAAEKKKVGGIGELLVFGCLSERYPEELPQLIPEVDAWFGAKDFEPIYEYLGVNKSRLTHTARVLTTPKHYAYFKISEGCDRRCSYCAIPFIRGKHTSIPIEDLVEEAKFLAAKGVKELMIIAQDTTFYGLDIYKRRALGELLERLSEVDGIEWMRIHYSYPASFPDDVIDIIANNPKVCRYMDIPLQHISDVVLKNMHRNVDGKTTRNLIKKMREKIPSMAIRTTMIVGHPGEGEAEYQELLEFVQDARFERLGAFKYSEEEGTYGAKHFDDSLSDEEKAQRLDELMFIQSEISLDFNTSRIGQTLKVIVDAFTDGVLVCRSEFESPEVDGEILVKYDSDALEDINPYSLIGEFINVKVIGANEYDLIAEVLGEF